MAVPLPSTVIVSERLPNASTASSLRVFQADVPLNGGVVPFHDVGDAPVAEFRHQLYLSVAGAGRVKEEPPDKGQPQATKVGAHEESKQT